MDTISFKIEENSAIIIRVNPKIYPLSVIYSASYVFLDKCYILLNGDPESEILVEIRSKRAEDLELLARDFFNELLNYSFYENQSKKNTALRETLLKAALLTNLGSEKTETEGGDDIDWSEIDDLDDEEFEDPEGIAIPWDEKYGDNKSDDKKDMSIVKSEQECLETSHENIESNVAVKSRENLSDDCKEEL